MIDFVRTHFRHLHNWLRAFLRWLFEARILWLALAVPAGALLFAVRRSVSEPEIRLTGLVLQVLGIATVAWGIRETRVLFGHPDLFTLAKRWCERFPVYDGRVVTANINTTASSAVMHGRAYVSSSASPNATVEERISVLERNIGHLNTRIDDTQREMDQGFHAQSDVVEKEKEERTAADQLLSTKLETTETGGLHISAMGALWLFIGITLSTASVELSAWFK